MLFAYFIYKAHLFSIEDLADADNDILAQAFMERCLDQGGNEIKCRYKTLEMFGTTGNTRIDIKISGGSIDGMKFGPLISKGSRDLRSKTVEKSKCKAQHTIYYGGQCHCRLFYDFGDPIRTGCWRCRPRCHINAICTQYQGCVCSNFTLGDGYKKCDAHIPHILRAYSKEDKKTIIVEIKPVQWEFPHVAYCKFNNIIIEGSLIKNDTIRCVRKNKKKKNSKVEVSWDSISFTHQQVPVLDFEQIEKDSSGPLVLGIVILFIGLTLYGTFLYKRGTSDEKAIENYAETAMKRGKL